MLKDWTCAVERFIDFGILDIKRPYDMQRYRHYVQLKKLSREESANSDQETGTKACYQR